METMWFICTWNGTDTNFFGPYVSEATARTALTEMVENAEEEFSAGLMQAPYFITVKP